MRYFAQWVRLETPEEAEVTKLKFFRQNGFPNVVGLIDGTHVKIQAPTRPYNELEFVNRKHFHSINVQVICNADLVFTSVVARWPGSVHDARILRQSALFEQQENGRDKPFHGLVLGDSGYMLREWLFTPILEPADQQQENYNFAQTSTRTAVERSIGVAKRRWNCLRHLRLSPEKACRVISVCVMLHNRARQLNLVDLDDEEDVPGDEADMGAEPVNDMANRQNERARAAAGKAARNQLVRKAHY